MKRSVAHLPLHTGKAPPWLFRRMTKLAGAVTMAVVEEFGPEEMLRRLADPWWFQAFGCALGFDWHSSGLTTVTCGALKEAAQTFGSDLGLLVAGGKGRVSRKTPLEIAEAADRRAVTQGDRLIAASRMSAKVDSAAVQDGFGLYHHCFVFTPQGRWCVIQQGMSETSRWARRYHWLSEGLDDFVCEPHTAIRDLADSETEGSESPRRPLADGAPEKNPSRRKQRQRQLLNMVAEEADPNRRASAALVCEHPDWLLEQFRRYTEGPTLFAPSRHRVLETDINAGRLRKLVIAAHERQPEDFAALLGTEGIGPAAIRSLALLAELIFEAPVSHRDPARRPLAAEGEDRSSNEGMLAKGARSRELASGNSGMGNGEANGMGSPPPASSSPPPDPTSRKWADYSYTHGGKDATPFPVDRATYDRNIGILIEAVRRARLGENDKFHALKRLAGMDRS